MHSSRGGSAGVGCLDADIVWLWLMWWQVQTDSEEVKAGLNDHVTAEGTQVWVLQFPAPEAELAPVLTRKMVRVWVQERGLARGRMQSGMGVPTHRWVLRARCC
jgi:hypothetical protein